jgi:acyl-coenzyme A thioesterase PaaI-like protein
VTDWPARADAARALRRLNRAFAATDVEGDVLRDLSAQADALAAVLEAGVRRDKEADTAALAEGRPAAAAAAVGDRVEFDPFSACGGRFHPAAVGLELVRDGDAAVAAYTTVDGMFQGPPGRVHGGVVAMIADEVMGMVNRVVGQRAFTARLTVNLRAPAPTGVPLEFRAHQRGREGRKILIDVEGRTVAGPFMDGEALFIEIGD